MSSARLAAWRLRERPVIRRGTTEPALAWCRYFLASGQAQSFQKNWRNSGLRQLSAAGTTSALFSIQSMSPEKQERETNFARSRTRNLRHFIERYGDWKYPENQEQRPRARFLLHAGDEGHTRRASRTPHDRPRRASEGRDRCRRFQHQRLGAASDKGEFRRCLILWWRLYPCRVEERLVSSGFS